MYLTRLIYCSTHASAADDIEHILASSRRHNSAHFITGALLFNRGYFLQCLEGGRIAVNETYGRILRDERHTDSVLLSYDAIERREFGDWAMGYVAFTKELRPIVQAYGCTDDFNPYEMTAAGALGLLRELRNTLTVL